jgi:hypothetical protein
MNNTTEFPIERNYYDEHESIYEKDSVELKPGTTVLVGCNGSGKTTLLKQIEQQCKKNKIPCFKFDNLTDGKEIAKSKALLYGNLNFLSQSLCSSEGENISQNITQCARQIGQFVNKNASKKKIFILFDAIDSGLSVDNILETKEYLFKTIIDDCKNNSIDAYIIVSANEYEMTRGEQCLTIPNLVYQEFKTYTSYRNFIIASRKKKNKRYKWEKFDLK